MEEKQVTPAAEQHDKTLTHISCLPASFRNSIEKGYSTGFEGLDKILMGLRRGEVTVITADTGAGKTTFCTQLVVNCILQGIPSLINSWEMKPEVTMRKVASIILRKPMRLQAFTVDDNSIFDDWARQAGLYINETTCGTDLKKLEKQLCKAKEKGVQIVMLDHLDYLVNSRKEKLHEAIDETVKRIHELAFSLEMHILLICHPRQSSTNTEEIGMHSLKGSSSIKQYADNIITLHRCARTDTSAHPGKLKVRVAKNRMFGNEGNSFLFYQPLWDGYVTLFEHPEEVQVTQEINKWNR
jgi:twinkle protein